MQNTQRGFHDAIFIREVNGYIGLALDLCSEVWLLLCESAFHKKPVKCKKRQYSNGRDWNISLLEVSLAPGQGKNTAATPQR